MDDSVESDICAASETNGVSSALSHLAVLDVAPQPPAVGGWFAIVFRSPEPGAL